MNEAPLLFNIIQFHVCDPKTSLCSAPLEVTLNFPKPSFLTSKLQDIPTVAHEFIHRYKAVFSPSEFLSTEPPKQSYPFFKRVGFSDTYDESYTCNLIIERKIKRKITMNIESTYLSK